MPRYQNFDGTVAEIKQEMLLAEFRVRGYVPLTGHPGLWGPSTGTPGNPNPGGRPTIAAPGFAGGANVGIDGYTEEFFDAEDIFLRSDFVPLIFDNTRGMPKAANFELLVTSVAQSLIEISVGGEMEGVNLHANEAMKEIETIQRVLGRMQGTVVDTFLSQYIDPLNGKVINLMLVMKDLLIAAASEQQLWSAAVEEWNALTNGAISAYQECSAEHGESEGLKALLVVAGLAAAVAGVVVSGGAAVIVALAGAGIGILDDTLPEPKPVTYPGGLPNLVTQSMGDAVVSLGVAIREQETEIELPISLAVADLAADPNQYRLDRVASLETSSQKGDYFRGIQVTLDEIRKVAHESVPTLANQFLKAADQLGQALSITPWQRDYAGNVPTGPGFKVVSLAQSIEVVLREYHHNITNAGLVLAAAADAYEMTDYDFEMRMKEVQQKLN